MKTAATVLCAALSAALLASCPNEGGGTVYTVTVIQPESGGEINASPLSGAAGAVIALYNEPDSGYTFRHYTVNGAEIGGGAFTLSGDSTVSGVFTADEPDTPDTPDTPDEPDTPDTPDTPDEPDTPDTPDTPDEPDTPDTPDTPDEPDTPSQPATLKIDGVAISIPVPAEGVNTIEVVATVSNGKVTEFDDPSGVLDGKTVNLSFGAAASNPAAANDPTKKQLNYSAISAIENAFKSKGAASVSSDTESGVIPVFSSYFDLDANTDAINNLISSKDVSAQTPEAHVINNIKVFYNSGNPILKVQSPMQLTGRILLTDLKKIQADTGMIHADDTLLLGTNRTTFNETGLDDFLEAYKACGFVVSPNTGISATETYFDTDVNATELNKFFPKHGYLTSSNVPINMNITSQQSSWGIYKLYEQYYHAGKLSNLSELRAQNITVAGNSAAGLYGSDNQPLASFPYKADGEILTFMSGFKGFENIYEADGDWSWPYNTMTVKNFATKSPLPNTRVTAAGACFFEYSPARVESTGAVKIMNIGSGAQIAAKYLDLRNLNPSQTRAVNNDTFYNNGNEIAFSSLSAAPQTYDDRHFLDYDTGYYVDSGVTKLIPTGTQYYASNQTSSIYGVLELQGWVNGNPPRNKAEIQTPSIVIKPYANQNPALFTMDTPALSAVLDDRRRGLPAGEGRAV